MVWLEASSRQELAEADEINKNFKLYSMPTDEMERLYLCGGAFKSTEQFQPCAKCGHNLVDKPAKNKSTMRHNKRIQLQWEEDSRKVADFLQGNSETLTDKKENPSTKVPNPIFWRSHFCATAGSNSCQPFWVGTFVFLIVLTKLLASITMRLNAPFVFVIAPSCVPNCKLLHSDMLANFARTVQWNFNAQFLHQKEGSFQFRAFNGCSKETASSCKCS
jgi:hypothetical protein